MTETATTPRARPTLIHPSSRYWVMALIAATAVAMVLRLWHLGDWAITGDEGFTINDSTSGFTWKDLRPLAFAMNHYLAIPLFGQTELAVRLFPALFGIAAIPLFGWLMGRLYGERPACARLCS